MFGSKPGAYGAGLQALIDEGGWSNARDLADVYLDWGGYAYGGGTEGEGARGDFAERLKDVDLVAQNQDNREHDILDSDDYYQFMGGLAATVQTLRGRAPRICPYRSLAAGSAAVAAAQPTRSRGWCAAAPPIRNGSPA